MSIKTLTITLVAGAALIASPSFSQGRGGAPVQVDGERTSAPMRRASPRRAGASVSLPRPSGPSNGVGTPTSNDLDGDGFSIPQDCDDGDAATYPGAPEIIDGLDNNCNGLVDEGASSPGGSSSLGNSSTGHSTSSGSSANASSNTASSSNALSSPGGTIVGTGSSGNGSSSSNAVGTSSQNDSGTSASYNLGNSSSSGEVCNDGIDNDGDGDTDFADSDCASQTDGDGDGFMSLQAGGLDCDDNDPATYPGANDPFNDGWDRNCDGND